MSKETLTEIKQMDWGNLKPSQIIAMDFLLEQVQKLETYVETGTYIQLIEWRVNLMTKSIMVICPNCKGDGMDRYYDYVDYMTPCQKCNGAGIVDSDDT